MAWTETQRDLQYRKYVLDDIEWKLRSCLLHLYVSPRARPEIIARDAQARALLAAVQAHIAEQRLALDAEFAALEMEDVGR